MQNLPVYYDLVSATLYTTLLTAACCLHVWIKFLVSSNNEYCLFHARAEQNNLTCIKVSGLANFHWGSRSPRYWLQTPVIHMNIESFSQYRSIIYVYAIMMLQESLRDSDGRRNESSVRFIYPAHDQFHCFGNANETVENIQQI